MIEASRRIVFWKVGTFAVILFCVVGWAFLSTSPVPPSITSAPEEQEMFWIGRIRALGGKAAYKEFSAYAHQQEKKIESIGHTLAHRFGSALYKEEGADGIVVCDTEFSFGCLHEWFKLAVAEHGVAPLEKMAEACKEAIGIWHPCQHAIGHGLLANAGYDEESLKGALKACKESYNDDPMNGCFGGVFMEYNLYTTLTLRAEPRPVEPGGWYAPCTSLGEVYKRSCYYWLPQWWNDAIRTSAKELSLHARFEELGKLCRDLPDTRYTRECFQRIGQLAAYSSKYEPESTVELCSVVSQSPYEDILCRSYASYIFSNMLADGLDKAYRVCQDLEPHLKEHCDSYARKEFFTPNDRPLPSSLL